jgi:hypothetical protein
VHNYSRVITESPRLYSTERFISVFTKPDTCSSPEQDKSILRHPIGVL